VIADMPRPRPPHLQREKTRHGKVVWYVRVGKGSRIRLRAAYGTPEFDPEYQAAVRGEPAPKAAAATKGTLAWLVEQHRDSEAWRILAPATRKQRENILLHVLKSAGAEPASAISRKTIIAGLERRARTPSAARNFLDTMRGIFQWAVLAEHVKTDPTAGVKPPKRPKTKGFPVWTEDDVDRYEVRWPIGTKERVWLDVLLYTGLRRGDVMRIGRQHVRAGIATLRTEKGGEQITVTIPILPVLQATLDAGPIGQLAFVCGDRGGPLTKESFGNMFSEAARAAGVRKSAHGVRKIGATRAAENGATVSELEAIFGWEGGKMAALYTRAADRARLARGAIGKLVRTPEEQSIPAPIEKVRAGTGKTELKQGLRK
jgi:integrase